jgi:hypothetical protein
LPWKTLPPPEKPPTEEKKKPKWFSVYEAIDPFLPLTSDPQSSSTVFSPTPEEQAKIDDDEQPGIPDFDNFDSPSVPISPPTSDSYESGEADSPYVPPATNSPPTNQEGPKEKTSTEERQLETLWDKVIWIMRVVKGKEQFAAPELPDSRGRIKRPEVMALVNLHRVLYWEPITCDLEQQLIDGYAGVAEHQVYIELLASQAVPQVRASVKVWEEETKALKDHYLPEYNTKHYATAELGAPEKISAQYAESL